VGWVEKWGRLFPSLSVVGNDYSAFKVGGGLSDDIKSLIVLGLITDCRVWCEY
jgi:hypothetical protein